MVAVLASDSELGDNSLKNKTFDSTSQIFERKC